MSTNNPKESSFRLPAEVTENDVENFLTVPAGTKTSLPLLVGYGFTTLLLSQIPGCTPQVQKDVSEATPTIPSAEITSELTSKQYLLAQDFINFVNKSGIPFTPGTTQLVTLGCNFLQEGNQEVSTPLPFTLADPESKTTLEGETFGLIAVREKGPDGQLRTSALIIARENKKRISQDDPFFNYTVFIWEEGVFKSMSTNERIVVKEDNHLYLVDENNNTSLIGIPSDREIHPRICQQATFDVIQLPPTSPTVKDSDQPILVATLSQVQQIDLSTDPSMLLAQVSIISDISPHPSSPSSPTPTPTPTSGEITESTLNSSEVKIDLEIIDPQKAKILFARGEFTTAEELASYLVLRLRYESPRGMGNELLGMIISQDVGVQGVEDVQRIIDNHGWGKILSHFFGTPEMALNLSRSKGDFMAYFIKDNRGNPQIIIIRTPNSVFSMNENQPAGYVLGIDPNGNFFKLSIPRLRTLSDLPRPLHADLENKTSWYSYGVLPNGLIVAHDGYQIQGVLLLNNTPIQWERIYPYNRRDGQYELLNPRERVRKAIAEELAEKTGNPKITEDWGEPQEITVEVNNQEVKLKVYQLSSSSSSKIFYEVIEDPNSGEMLVIIRQTDENKGIKGLNENQRNQIIKALAYLLSADPDIMTKMWREGKVVAIGLKELPLNQASTNELINRRVGLILLGEESIEIGIRNWGLGFLLYVLLAEHYELTTGQHGYDEAYQLRFHNGYPPCISNNLIHDAAAKTERWLEEYAPEAPPYSTAREIAKQIQNSVPLPPDYLSTCENNVPFTP